MGGCVWDSVEGEWEGVRVCGGEVWEGDQVGV